MVQLVFCSVINAADRLDGWISTQIGAVLNLTLCLQQQEMKELVFIHFKQVLGYKKKKQQLVERAL